MLRSDGLAESWTAIMDEPTKPDTSPRTVTCVKFQKEMPALDKLQETLGKPSETLERCLDLGGTGVDGRIFGL